ncbi:E3 ubiquitin ligase family protein [Nocardia sp. BMG51109]|uniref:E3 ubiquitin ligase family protein n=1 Tax=Nocardia sp. BMG51109 TaxID=1056816 RepID=UPI0004665A38|nr:E3 ubiquitin ligase family protein [Nocardia sp. BMG51109]
MWWFIVAALACVVAGFGLYQLSRLRGKLIAMIGAEELSIPELEQFRQVSDELGARGGFRKTSEVSGAAHPHPDGPLVAELSQTECVWYRYRVDRHYEDIEHRNGRRTSRRRSEKVAEQNSWQGFALIDGQGRTLGVDPNGTAPDGAVQTVNRFEPHRGEDSGNQLLGMLSQVLTGGGDTTIGYEYKEWIIPLGHRLYILGEVHDRIGPLVIGKPERGGHFIISTRTEGELREEATKHHKLWVAGVIAAAVLAAATLIGGIVTAVA